MRSDLLKLVSKFTSGQDLSIQLANEIEVLLDDRFPDDDRIQETVTMLAMYRPGGGEFLFDHEAISDQLNRVTAHIESKLRLRAVDIERVVWGLEALSDKTFQKRVWANIDNVDGEMSSFVEAICHLFDGTDLGRQLDRNQQLDHISPENRGKLVRLRGLVGSMPHSGSPLDIIGHPAMEDIRKLSKEILDSLNTSMS